MEKKQYDAPEFTVSEIGRQLNLNERCGTGTRHEGRIRVGTRTNSRPFNNLASTILLHVGKTFLTEMMEIVITDSHVQPSETTGFHLAVDGNPSETKAE